jgi:hypothetical protein
VRDPRPGPREGPREKLHRPRPRSDQSDGPRTSERFGSLEAGKTSRYHAANRAYIFPYIEALLDGTVVRQQPRDFVGEEPMEPGTYTYELRLSSKQPYFLHATVIRE